MNFRVTTNQKFVIDTNYKKRKKSKWNTKDSHQITREESSRRQAPKRNIKQLENN